MLDLSILIVNYKSPDYTVDCLCSLEKERNGGVGFDVWLMDNDSGDGSAECIRKAIVDHGWSGWVNFIESPENLGFAGGNNALLERVQGNLEQPSYVLLLNNDTVVHPGCLAYVLEKLKQDPTISLMSCNLLNGDGSIQNVARRMPTPLTETLTAFGLPYSLPKLFGWADLEDAGWDRATETRDVDWLGGAFMCMPIETAQRTGLFDTDFFFYGEDIELCHRIRKQGGRIVFDPGTSTTHFGGGSSDAKQVLNRRRETFHWRGRLLVQKKCFGHFGAGIAHTAYVVGFFLRKWSQILKGHKDSASYLAASEGLHVLTHLNAEL
jgi:GT2 family glycosyltransferase